MATRNIPDHYNGKHAAVVIKQMADLVMSGALKHLDNIHVDWTTDSYSQYLDIEKMINAVGYITKIAKEKNLTHIVDIERKDNEFICFINRFFLTMLSRFKVKKFFNIIL